MWTLRYAVLSGLTLLLVLSAGVVAPGRSLPSPNISVHSVHPGHPTPVAQTTSSPDSSPQLQAQLRVDQGRQLYRSGRLEEAAAELEAALDTYRASQNVLGEAMALSNLALVQGQQGAWGQAEQSIRASLSLLPASAQTPEQRSLRAQVLDVQGKLQYAQGQPRTALETWKQTTKAYQQANDSTRTLRSQIRQSQALQAIGLYDQAKAELKQLEPEVTQQPDTAAKVANLQNLGEALQAVEAFSASQRVLKTGVDLATQLNDAELLAATRLSWANTLYAQSIDQVGRNNKQRSRIQADIQQAKALYQQVEASETSAMNRLYAQLNHLSFAIAAATADADDSLQQLQDAQTLWPGIDTALAQLPATPARLQARLNWSKSLMDLNELLRQKRLPPEGLEAVRDGLTGAYEQTQESGDRRTQAEVLGQLGQLYAFNQDFSQAKNLTEKAVVLAKSINAPDVIYRWYAQEGKILDAQGDAKGAIQAYGAAVQTLGSLSADLANINPGVLFSFQESVEPIHRELVRLLLERNRGKPTQQDLERARQVMESLRVEELHEYLRASCLESLDVEIGDIASQQNTAVIYPIILEDRLAIIVQLPDPVKRQQPINRQQPTQRQQPTSPKNSNLKLYSVQVPSKTLEAEVNQLRKALRNRISLGYRKPAQDVYQWLFPPELEQALADSQTETLVFVLDGVLRNIPMAALSDGESYLLEKYSLAVTPGLQLTDPQALNQQRLDTVAFGLSQGREVNLPERDNPIEFSDLPNVTSELEGIQAKLNLPKEQVLLDEEFTPARFKQVVTNSETPIVHLATHGKFSSDRDSTFLLAAKDMNPALVPSETVREGLIDLDLLSESLQVGSGKRSQPIELLVLSACETAFGDDRAALGIAGVALRSGARSTVASLWQVDDDATSVLMEKFYTVLQERQVTKAEALRQAQLEILQEPRFRRHPYNWAPFILVGNWL